MDNTVIEGHPLKLERDQRNLSQQQLADFTELSRSTIQRAERGRPIRPDARERLCQFFGLSSTELGLMPPTEHNHVLHGKEDDDMNRRDAIRLVTIAGFSALTGKPIDPDAWQRLTVAAEKVSGVDSATLENFSSITLACWHIINGSNFVNESDTMSRSLASYLPQFTAIVDQSSQDKTAASIAAQGYMIAALIAMNKYNAEGMERNSERSIKYANVAGEPNIMAAAYKQQATMLQVARKTRKALQTYQQCLPFIEKVSPLLQSRIYQGLANLSARCNLEQEALKYLTLARDTFPDNYLNDPSFLFADTTPSVLQLYLGLTYLDLNDATSAWDALAAIDGLAPKMKIGDFTRLEFLNLQAKTAIVMRDLDRCEPHLGKAIELSTSINSQYNITESHEIYRTMQLIWPTEPRVKALGEMIYGGSH
jgi:transcriptional regulator with XRE-family HTH domain/tetratricopeptide (TPR) repeat protein